MTAIPLAAARDPRSQLLRFVIDHNPFYLLSAICMLGGCVTLANSVSYSPIPQYRLLLLIGTLNCYELLLVGLALWLIVQRNLVRDGMILLGIEALFLVDTTMLNAELFMVDQRLGVVVNALLLLLAAGKLAVIFKALRIQSAPAYALILIHLALLFALPGFFKQISHHYHGRLTEMAIYSAWWAVGVLPVLISFVLRGPNPVRSSSTDMRPKNYGRLVGLFIGFAFASILLHLRLSNWVYKVDWQWANVGPLFLGLAVAIGSMDHHVHTLALRMRAQLALPSIAVACSVRFADDLVFAMGGVTLSPMRLTIIGAMIVYLHGLWLHRHGYFAVASSICFAAIGLGSSPGDANQHLMDLWNWMVNTIRRMIPRTTTDWGVLSVAASFGLLVLGAAVSLLKGTPMKKAPDDSDIVPPTNA